MPSLRSVLTFVSSGLLLALGATRLPGAAPIAADAPPTFGSTVGVCARFSAGQSLDDLPILLDLGVKWVRDTEAWRLVEPNPGQYALSDAVRRRLAFYREHDIGVVFGLWYGNATAYGEEDRFNAAAYGRYAAWVARQLESARVRYVLEVWNEPHNFDLGPKLGGNWDGAPPSPWLDQYMKMLRAAVREVKAVVPGARIIASEGPPVCHYWYAEAGLPAELDGGTFHHYAHKPTPGPEVLHYGPGERGAKPFDVVDESRSFRSMATRFEALYAGILGHKPLIMVTEAGCGLGKKVFVGGPITEEIAAAFLVREFINNAAVGIEATLWFASKDVTDGPWGLIANDGTKRQTYFAMREMTRRLGNSRLVRQIAGIDDTTQGPQAYLFEGPLGHQVVVWQIGEPVSVAIETGSADPLRVSTVVGERVEPYARDAITPTLEVGLSPLYVSGVDADVALLPCHEDLSSQ